MGARVLDRNLSNLWDFKGVAFRAREISSEEAVSLVPIGLQQGLEFSTILQCTVENEAFEDGFPVSGNSLSTCGKDYRVQGVSKTPNDHMILIFLAS